MVMKMPKTEAIGPIAVMLSFVVPLGIGASWHSVNPNFDPSGFYWGSAGLFLIGIFLVLRTNPKLNRLRLS